MIETEVKFELTKEEYMNMGARVPDYFIQQSPKLLVDIITNIREVERGNGKMGNDFDRFRIVLNDDCLDEIVAESKKWKDRERVETPILFHQVKKQRINFVNKESGITISMDKLQVKPGDYRYFMEVEIMSEKGGADMKDFVVRFAREELGMGEREEAGSYLRILGIVK